VERSEIIAVTHEPRFTDTPPARIVPMLADGGRYIACESTFHRVLRAWPDAAPRPRPSSNHAHRHPSRRGVVLGRDVPAGPRARPVVLSVSDRRLNSRKIVSFEVHDTDSAAHRPLRTVFGMADKPVLHGATLKATTVLAMLHWLDIKPSYSRPRIIDDNAFAEALLRTAKYRPDFPAGAFADRNAPGQ